MRLLPVLAPGERVLAAVSGGADSVALLLLLSEEARAGRIELVCAHLNHGIRGAAADRDQAFVRALAQQMGILLFEARADVPALCALRGQGLESCARDVRRAFLLRAKAEADCAVIATAHHAGDQAETVLMHLLRGGALNGAGGMAARDGAFARPLLDATKRQIYDFLAARNQPYCEDATNFVPDTPRNALRLEVFPRLQALYPGAEAALGRFADLAREASDFLDQATRAFLAENARLHPFGASLGEAEAHPAVWRSALHHLAGQDSAVAARLLALYRQARGALALKGFRAEKTGGRLYLIDLAKAPPQVNLPLADGAHVPGLGTMRLSCAAQAGISGDPLRQVLDADALAGAVLRLRRPGDVMRPLGAPGDKSLAQIMIDKKLARPRRAWQVIIARDERVLWVPGLAISEDAALTRKTRAALKLTWEREDDRQWTSK
ncbi:MAG: tRNA lysidine(34) synthetase TilS [Clostridia bacterium]